jgi:DNA-binding transcriptional MerR regulator
MPEVAVSGVLSSKPRSRRMLTTAEVDQIMRSPVSTLRYWRHLGAGPHSFRAGRRVVYRRADVTAWLHEQAEAGRADRAG